MNTLTQNRDLIHYISGRALTQHYYEANNIESILKLIEQAKHGADLTHVCREIMVHIASALFKVGHDIHDTVNRSIGDDGILPEETVTTVFKLQELYRQYSENNGEQYLRIMFDVCVKYLKVGAAEQPVNQFASKFKLFNFQKKIIEKINAQNIEKKKTYTAIYTYSNGLEIVVKDVLSSKMQDNGVISNFLECGCVVNIASGWTTERIKKC